MIGMPAAGASAAATTPLSERRLRAAAVGRGRLWTDIRVVGRTGSTNADALAQAEAGAPEGLVIAAEAQTAGRGRLGRDWLSVPRAALTFSVLLRPRIVPQAARGWLPLLAGVAVVSALAGAAGVDARLKWPNDVLADGGKLAGILAEQSGDAVVVGIGLNVRGAAADLPVATATSLEQHGAGQVDRTELLAQILRQLERWYLPWRGTGSGDADACGLRQEYLLRCATVGRQVRVRLPGDRTLEGTATGVDGTGRLLVSQENGETVAVSAGDVIHVR